MSFTYLRRAALALALLTAAGCTVKSTQPPPLTGPSGLALTIRVNALPDAINQDGGSQSSVKVTAIGPDGKGLASLALRLDMAIGGVVQDYGTLSARSVVTNSEGIATAVYTAPPSPVNGVFGICAGVPGNCVTIVATATSTDFLTASPEQVTIRLVPTGVIQPPAGSPTAAFTITPTPVNFNVASIFDASTTVPGTGATAIVSYAWTFGDGSSGTGKTVSHTYTQSTSPGNAYTVTLTVTNDRGLSSSTTQSVSVDASPAPTGDWVFSPTTPSVGDTVFFNASAMKPAAGHQIVQYGWNFGDGTTGSGAQVTHAFGAAATYQVVLTVIDDAGQRVTPTHAVAISSGNPVALFTSSAVAGHTMFFDGGGSTASGTATIVSYQWAFGDGTTGTGQTLSHTYPALGTYSVRLTVTDSFGRIGTSAPTAVTVP
jgi:PKD repeat protein